MMTSVKQADEKLNIYANLLEALQVREGKTLASLQAIAVSTHRDDFIVEGQGAEAQGPTVR